MHITQKEFERSVAQYITEEIRNRSIELSKVVGEIGTGAFINYNYYNRFKNAPIAYTFPTIYQLQKLGLASKYARDLTDRLLLLDPEKMALIFGNNERINIAFTAIKSINSASTCASALYDVGSDLLSGSWQVAVAVGGYLGCPNPIDYIPEVAKVMGRGAAKVASKVTNDFKKIGGEALSIITQLIMDNIKLEEHTDSTLNKGLPLLLTKINQLFNRVESEELVKISMKALAKMIELESLTKANVGRLYETLTPEERLLSILEYCQKNNILPHILPNERIGPNLEDHLQQVFENYIETRFIPVLSNMIIPEHLEALSHFFGVMLDTPHQDIFKSIFMKLLSTHLHPEQLKETILNLLRKNDSVTEGSLIFEEKDKVQEILDFWMINRESPCVEEALDMLESEDLVRVATAEEERAYKSDESHLSRLISSVRRGFMELSQKPNWKLMNLFFLEGLHHYLENISQIMETEAMPPSVHVTDRLQELESQMNHSVNLSEKEQITILTALTQPTLGSRMGKMVSKVGLFFFNASKGIRKKVSQKANIDLKTIFYEKGTLSIKTRTVITKLYKILQADTPNKKQVINFYFDRYLNDYVTRYGKDALFSHIEFLLSSRSNAMFLERMKTTRYNYLST
ncbi:MAG: hypothetical protein WAM28_02255 [Chlamydiales bacterium]